MSDPIFKKFPARAYLDKYYGYVGEENAGWLEGIISAAERLTPPNSRAIEVGGGPVIAPMLALHAAGAEIDSVTFTDYAEQNLDEGRAWVEGKPGSFVYDRITGWIIDRSGWSSGAAELERQVRDLDWTFAAWDVSDGCPEHWRGQFGILSSHFFAESATSSIAEMKQFLGAIADAGSDGALVSLSFMRTSLGYTIDGVDFPAVSLDETGILEILDDAGMKLEDVAVSHLATEDPPTRPGYSGMFFVSGRLVR